MADRCRALGLEFIDAAGNAYLNAPGLYVFVKGQKAVAGGALAGPQRGGGNATALRMIFALLCHPELVHAPYREIVKAAGIALGAVGWVFHDLTRRGLMSGPDKAYGRRWLESGQMLDEWVTNYPIKLRLKLSPRRFRAPDPQWWQEARLKGLDAWWGGEVAADHLTGLLKPATQTLYVKPEAAPDCLRKLVSTYRLRLMLLRQRPPWPANTDPTDTQSSGNTGRYARTGRFHRYGWWNNRTGTPPAATP